MTFGTSRSTPYRVLVSDMSPLIASGVQATLASSLSFATEQFDLDHVFQGGLDGVAPFDLVIVDSASGLQLIKEMKASSVPVAIQRARIFVISHVATERDIRSALEAGIGGFATLSVTLAELEEGLRIVARGLRFVCPRAAQVLANSMTREPLTQRENTVLRKLALGCCNKTIAYDLQMALGTVKAHVKALMSKLDAKTRTQVVTIAIARGLVEPIATADAADPADAHATQQRRPRPAPIRLAA